MNLVSPSTVARNQAVVFLIPTAMETSVHSSRPMVFPRLCARAILALSAQLRLSTTTDPSKSIVLIVPLLKKSTHFAHGAKSDISSRTRGLAQPDV
jgi:hypothetical protein